MQSKKKENKPFPPRWLSAVSKKELEASKGYDAIDFINTLCSQTKDTVAGKSGERLKLRSWQEDLLKHIFAVRSDGKLKHRTALVGMPRKNGKSSLGSGIGLWSLFLGVSGGEIYSCAADKEQARIVFGDAKKMIEAEPDLLEHCNIYRDAIEVPSTGSVYRVLSSENLTKEGLSPTLILYDEIHAAPNRELFDVMSLGMGARSEPLLLAITTAGVKTDSTGQDSVAYSLYQYGLKVVRKEVLDSSFFIAWWEAPAESNHRERETWILANPAFGDINSEEDFISAVKRTPESEFRTKRTNAWVSSQQSWLSAGSWEKLENKKEISPDTEIILGFDGSFSGDASVVVGVTIEEQPYVFLVKAWEKQVTDTEDWRVDSLEVENTIIEFCKNHKVKEIACDPFRWQRTMSVLQDLGLPIVEWNSTSPARMVPACAKFYDAVMSEKVTHDGDGLIIRHISNAVIKTDRLGPRIVKEHRGSLRKIDGAVAAIIAFDRATVSRQGEVEDVSEFYF